MIERHPRPFNAKMSAMRSPKRPAIALIVSPRLTVYVGGSAEGVTRSARKVAGSRSAEVGRARSIRSSERTSTALAGVALSTSAIDPASATGTLATKVRAVRPPWVRSSCRKRSPLFRLWKPCHGSQFVSTSAIEGASVTEVINVTREEECAHPAFGWDSGWVTADSAPRIQTDWLSLPELVEVARRAARPRPAHAR